MSGRGDGNGGGRWRGGGRRGGRGRIVLKRLRVEGRGGEGLARGRGKWGRRKGEGAPERENCDVAHCWCSERRWEGAVEDMVRGLERERERERGEVMRVEEGRRREGRERGSMQRAERGERREGERLRTAKRRESDEEKEGRNGTTLDLPKRLAVDPFVFLSRTVKERVGTAFAGAIISLQTNHLEPENDKLKKTNERKRRRR